ncbi:hypothetical protein BC629DRAFT_121998 [Irpex lacteus]|nr:hypothetical protein BC629DRAFT_121998 [Irpex lacteus]
MSSSTFHERPAVSAMSSAGTSLSCGETRSPSPQPPPSSSRLPSYRSSYCGRYHPYGRKLPRKGQEIDLTFSAQKTIDMRYDNRASLSLSVVDEEDEYDLDGDGEDGDIESTTAVSPSTEGEGYQLSASPHSDKPMLVRRRSITDLVVEFAFAMRRSLRWRKRKLDVKS